MMIAPHKNARTTPAIRAKMAQSPDSVTTPAQRYSVSESTARKWKRETPLRMHLTHRIACKRH